MSHNPAIETGLDPLVKFDAATGLLPAIVQDADSGEILMLAYMNDQALQKTLETGVATFWSRSRQKFWIKGESSGNTQKVMQILVDCDQDALILKVRAAGPACHVGYRSCFYRAYESDGTHLKFIAEKVYDPEKVYGKQS